jgi:hypothetical protein
MPEHASLPLAAQELLGFEFDYRYMMRGLIIDKKRGNVLKMDRHKYVKVAFHGFRALSREERLATYANSQVGPPCCSFTPRPHTSVACCTEGQETARPCTCGVYPAFFGPVRKKLQPGQPHLP